MDVGQMISILQCYIHIRTDRQVTINTNNLDLFKLAQAYQYANDWLVAHNGRIDHYVG